MSNSEASKGQPDPSNEGSLGRLNLPLADFEGVNAHQAYRSLILAHPEITHFELCRYQPPPPLQDRIPVGPREEEIIQMALDQRKDGTTPFWHGVFASCLEKRWISRQLVEAALFHFGAGRIESHQVSCIKENPLTALFGTEEKKVGLSSRLLRSDGEAMHLALLDFRCEVSPANTKLLCKVCASLYSSGYIIIDSGDSYHSCGMSLVSDEGRVNFLGRALRIAPIVDTAYIGHQLQQSFSTIRISRGGSRNKVPQVVAAQSTQ